MKTVKDVYVKAINLTKKIQEVEIEESKLIDKYKGTDEYSKLSREAEMAFIERELYLVEEKKSDEYVDAKKNIELANESKDKFYNEFRDELQAIASIDYDFDQKEKAIKERYAKRDEEGYFIADENDKVIIESEEGLKVLEDFINEFNEKYENALNVDLIVDKTE